MKKGIPWPIKVGAKVGFAMLGLNYRLLKRAGLVEHGRMEDPKFAESVFERHVRAPQRSLGVIGSGVLLELGPGDSVFSGVLARQSGFERAVLVDAGQFADLRIATIAGLLTMIPGIREEISAAASTADVLAALERAGIAYLTEGTNSVRRLPPSSIGWSFSNSVLQHVVRVDVPGLINELARVHRPGSFTSHSINFTDHFSGGYLNQSLPNWLIESALFRRANLYTNRLRLAEYGTLFSAAGFALEHAVIEYSGSGDNRGIECSAWEAIDRSLGQGPLVRARLLMRKI